MTPERRFAVPVTIWKSNFLAVAAGAVIAGLVVSGGFLAALAVSNVLTFGPSQLEPDSQLTDSAVKLTVDRNLPASMTVSDEYEVRFRLQANQEVPDATMWFLLKAEGVSLNDPAIVQVNYRHPEDSTRLPVSLAPDAGSLTGTLISPWTIPQGYDGIGKVEITFESGAPAASYTAELWVETDASPGTSTSPSSSTGQTVQVQATDDKVFVPETITISVGDTVRWNNAGGTPHNVMFSNTSIPSQNFLAGGATYEVTFNQAGTFSYVCEFHPPDMVGTIIVQ